MDRALMFAIHICYFHLSLFIFCIFIIVLLYLQLHKLLNNRQWRYDYLLRFYRQIFWFYLDNKSWHTKQQSVLRQNMTKKINTIWTLIGYLSTAVFTKHLIGWNLNGPRKMRNYVQGMYIVVLPYNYTVLLQNYLKYLPWFSLFERYKIFI